MIILLYGLAFLLLLLLNAFFVLAEFAAVRIRGSRIEELVDQGRRRARLVQHIHANLDEYLSVCQVGITVASIALGFVGESAAAQELAPALVWLGPGSLAVAHIVAATVAVLVVSFVHILIGEQVPKLIAIRQTDRWALWTALPLRWSHRLFFVPLWLLNTCSHDILRLLGYRATSEREQVSEDELRIILERSQSGGLMSFRRLLFMENIFDLGELKVRDAMRPRSQVQVLRTGMTWDEIERVAREFRYSRFPLFGDDPGRPLGFVHVKDILLTQRQPGQPVDLAGLARPFLATNEGAPLEGLLAEMQRRRVHAALVTDREGDWIGLITMEDIIEEIIGTVDDEFVRDPPMLLVEALTVERIILDLEAPSVGEAIRQAFARIPLGDLPLPADEIVRAVLDRERLASTYLGRGLAMPHARLPCLAKPILLVLRSTGGIPCATSAEKAHLLFVLLTPAGLARVHQRLQARIAALLEKSDYVEERLHRAATPAEMYEVIRTGEQASLD
jgi:CBS domain containing-hemolysin-like protein/mannitol/fructose-specific phosphotransferase system IIA component (Ntr-type)